MISIDAGMSFSMLVAVTAFYAWYGRKRCEPDELGKMIIGSFFTIGGGLCLVMAAATQGDGKIGLMWPILFHLFNSIGFAHILPVSLALFSRLAPARLNATIRSEEHTSELQSLMRISYAVFCLKKKKTKKQQ